MRVLGLLALPLAAIAVVVAVQLWPQPAPSIDRSAPVPAAVAPDPLTDVALPGTPVSAAMVDTSDTDGRIAYWQDRLRTTPRSDTAWTYLGELYDQKARQTGDLSNYTLARDAFATAVDISPSSPTARIGLARIDIALHDFEGALLGATDVLAEYPSAHAALAIVFDAAYELGDLDIAATALSQLQERAMSPAVTVRAARLAFVLGDAAGAVALASAAADNAAGRGETGASVAFFRYVAAEYALLSGDIAAADAGYLAALEDLPGYSLAVAGRGRAALARGDLPAATGFLETATAAVPRPDHVALLGDLYALAGRSTDAEAQYATVEFIRSLAGSTYDREYVLFLADHGRDTALAVELARAEAEVRRDVFGLDAFAWALHADGQHAEALTTIREALAVGTVDARLHIHAGLIEIANGLADEGRAHITTGLALEPAFSPLVVEAAKEAVTP